ncbi:ABC transporter ATP-binding protein [Paenibacillus sp. CN-4]|uniref:ABC transporter ATP-binding protein n=1 Tax=Paenibacillus nanchangensis TaxID=3348343 RepID=UPI003979F082
MILMNEVSKIYETKERAGWLRRQTKQVQAVTGLTMTIEPGEIVGLLGLNGAGKTTTIRMLSTLLDPTLGTIEVDGLAMNRHRKEIQRKINMIAGGERMLYWRLTGRENLEYFGKLYGLDARILKDISSRLLTEVGLGDAADRPVEQYSKGMKQRLQIARGLINDPDYLFLDEPTLGLDAPIARQLRSTVASLAKEQGKGILLTSHYLQEVEELCDRVYILDQGRLLLQDRPERIVSRIAGAETAHLELEGWNELLRPELFLLSGLREDTTEIRRDENSKSGTACRISVRTPSAERVISELLPWADRHGMRIVGFTAEKPSLEDAIILLSEGKAS